MMNSHIFMTPDGKYVQAAMRETRANPVAVWTTVSDLNSATVFDHKNRRDFSKIIKEDLYRFIKIPATERVVRTVTLRNNDETNS